MFDTVVKKERYVSITALNSAAFCTALWTSEYYLGVIADISIMVFKLNEITTTFRTPRYVPYVPFAACRTYKLGLWCERLPWASESESIQNHVYF